MRRLQFMFDTLFHSKKEGYFTKKNDNLKEIPRESTLGRFLFIWLRIVPVLILFIVSIFIIFFGNDMVRIYSDILSISNVSNFHHIMAILIPVVLIISLIVVVVSFFTPNDYKKFI